MAASQQMIEIATDLSEEQAALDIIVASLDDAAWRTPTPSEGWDVADQIGHLTFFDVRATMAITEPDAFTAELVDAASDIEGYMEGHLAESRNSSPSNSLEAWRAARTDLHHALVTLEPRDRVRWYGPSMSARSFATARLMEVWAHGQDIVDAVGASREPTARLRHIALLGVKTLSWAFSINGLPVPEEPVRVSLTGPGGESWVWNDGASTDSVSGSAEDFCLVVTQRRNVADTGLRTTGDVAARWMQIAQAFAGPPGPGRAATHSE